MEWIHSKEQKSDEKVNENMTNKKRASFRSILKLGCECGGVCPRVKTTHEQMMSCYEKKFTRRVQRVSAKKSNPDGAHCVKHTQIDEKGQKEEGWDA